MQEFAAWTHQRGAKDDRPAIIDQAAMPVRVEKWIVDNKIKYRVVGILWGGSPPGQGLGNTLQSGRGPRVDRRSFANHERSVGLLDTCLEAQNCGNLNDSAARNGSDH